MSYAVWGANVNASANDNAPLVYFPTWTFLFLCPVVVGTRIWSMKRASGLGIDDYTIVLSLIFAVATDIIILWGCSNGYGKHTETLAEDEKRRAFISFYILQTTYKISINLTKSAIVLLYLRVFGGVAWCRRTCYALLALIASFSVAVIVASVCECLPVVAVFDKTVADKRCINNGPFRFANAGFSIATDLLVVAVPVPLVRSLQIPPGKKLVLILGFGLGIFVVITSILRVTTIDAQVRSRDPLYDVASTMWTIIEMSMGIICACIPQIRILVVKMFCRIVPGRRDSEDGTIPLESRGSPRQTSEEADKWPGATRPAGDVELAMPCVIEAAPEEPPRVEKNNSRAEGIRKTVEYGYVVQHQNSRRTWGDSLMNAEIGSRCNSPSVK